MLALVPARSGSRGIPDKNMRRVGGRTLIAHAANVLREVPFLDARVISTDSADYAAEGQAHGLDAPFLRPADLSSDEAGSVDVMLHALDACEEHYGAAFDVVLLVEPTSPLRTAGDLAGLTERLVRTPDLDSVVAVSVVPHQYHPAKLLRLDGERLRHYRSEEAPVVRRQDLAETYCWRNGVGYAIWSSALRRHHALFTDRTAAFVVEHPVVNIDDVADLEEAERYWRREPGL